MNQFFTVLWCNYLETNAIGIFTGNDKKGTSAHYLKYFLLRDVILVF